MVKWLAMKNRKIVILVAVIAGIILIGIIYTIHTANKKREMWNVTYANNDTRPYGTYITYQLLKEVFDPQGIISTRKPIYNNLKDSLNRYFYYPEDDKYTRNTISEDTATYDYDDIDIEREIMDQYPDSIWEDEDIEEEIDPLAFYKDITIRDTASYIFINSDFSVQDSELKYLLNFVGLGNNVFISSERFSYNLMDTLGLRADIQYSSPDTIYTLTDYKKKTFTISPLYYRAKLNADSCKLPVRVLGVSNINNDTIFMQVKYGCGNFYFHTVPTAFVNLNMLNLDKYDFGFRCLSYLPYNNNIIWDEYQTQGPVNNLFQEMLKNHPLKASLILIFIGFGLFLIFRAKRTQRVIPIIKPPVNSSIEFLDTISNLFYKKMDTRSILDKRHAYLLDFIRKSYYLATEHTDGEFIKNLSTKSTMEESKLEELFALYQDMKTLYYIPNEKFLKYNGILEEFYKTAKHK